ncbi:MAG: conjugative transposon protein TraM [Ferruginibacter sp.]
MNETKSPQFLRKRKMMVMLPVLVLPFLTMAFWALGGGKGVENENQLTGTGLNLELPDAKIKDNKNGDKLSFYNAADLDSIKRKEMLRNDPYYKDSTLMDVTSGLSTLTFSKEGLNNSPYSSNAATNEQKIYQKIKEINHQLVVQPDEPEKAGTPLPDAEAFSKQVDRMQGMMQVMTGKEEADPEMQDLNGTLEKILDIQHPERIKNKLLERSIEQKQVAFIVSKDPGVSNVSLLDTFKNTPAASNKFYGTEENVTETGNSIEAVVHANQILVSGAVIKLRLSTSIYISGILIPKGNFIYGIAELNDERLTVEINAIRYGNSIFPVKLEVYDMDGLPGIYIPGAISREVAKKSADNSLQLMDLSSADASVKVQAATAGIGAAKSLLSKKVKLIKVMVKAGYKILLNNKI